MNAVTAAMAIVGEGPKRQGTGANDPLGLIDTPVALAVSGAHGTRGVIWEAKKFWEIFGRYLRPNLR